MSDILNDLNVDKEDFDWQHLAVCSGLDTNLFYDKYEADVNIAKSIDQMCLACPVISICHENGVENDEHGVWGGVYMSSGSVDKARNTHKSQEIWKQLKRKHVYR
jgi:hypothetical protein